MAFAAGLPGRFALRVRKERLLALAPQPCLQASLVVQGHWHYSRHRRHYRRRKRRLYRHCRCRAGRHLFYTGNYLVDRQCRHYRHQ